jgi:hypothetical protein
VTRRDLFALAVTAAALGLAAWRLRDPHAAARRERLDVADALAAWVVQETAGSGAGALLILAPPGEEGDPFPGRLRERFVAQARRAGFDPVHLEELPRAGAMEQTGEPVEREVFLAALARHADARLVISLAGVPKLPPGRLPGEAPPRLVVASTAFLPFLGGLVPEPVSLAVTLREDPRVARGVPLPGALGDYFQVLR